MKCDNLGKLLYVYWRYFAFKTHLSQKKTWICFNINTEVSKNSGTPKSSILIGFSIINHPFWGTPIFGNTHTKAWVLSTPETHPLSHWDSEPKLSASWRKLSRPNNQNWYQMSGSYFLVKNLHDISSPNFISENCTILMTSWHPLSCF